MTGRLADVTTQIRSIRQLKAIVVAMRGMAASRAQQGRALIVGIEAYAQVVSAAIGQALNLLPAADPAPRGMRRDGRSLILLCSEQGFVGAHNERILAAAAADLAASTNFVIGTRGLTLAGERAIKVAWSAAMATQAGAIPALANRMTEAVYERVAAGAITEVDIVYPRFAPGGSIQIERHSLFPVDLARFARPVDAEPPLTTLAPGVLLERLVAEYVYAELCAAATFAFVAEHEARMNVMAAAKTNIEGKLGVLGERERQLRQQEVTAEVVELAAGADAVTRRP